MIGIGKTFDGPAKRNAGNDNNIEMDFMGNNFKTNHGGTSAARGYELEIKKNLTKNSALSLSYDHEGKDRLVNRDGIATQLWYIYPLSAQWTASVGAGPYIAKNKLVSDETTLNGLISIEFKKYLGNRASAFVRFSRISDFKGDNDRYVLSFGVAKKF
jgi:hypothetical protein